MVAMLTHGQEEACQRPPPPDWSEQGAGVSWVRAAGRGLQGWGTCLVSEFLTPASRDGVAWGWGVTWKHHVAT